MNSNIYEPDVDDMIVQKRAKLKAHVLGGDDKPLCGAEATQTVWPGTEAGIECKRCHLTVNQHQASKFAKARGHRLSTFKKIPGITRLHRVATCDCGVGVVVSDKGIFDLGFYDKCKNNETSAYANITKTTKGKSK